MKRKNAVAISLIITLLMVSSGLAANSVNMHNVHNEKKCAVIDSDLNRNSHEELDTWVKTIMKDPKRYGMVLNG